MAKTKFNPSANLENGMAEGVKYIVTPNAEKVLQEIVSAFQTGIHSFCIIGTYGTGKSSFLLQLESDLASKRGALLKSKGVLHKGDFEVLNIIGDSRSLNDLLVEKLSERTKSESTDAIQLLKTYHANLKKQDKLLLIAIDEFGKVLEHAAKHDPETDLYFMQKLAEFINANGRNILLLTTLHQNFSAYASKLSQTQKNEWTKVKGRFQEVVFAEPIEQLLYLAAEHIQGLRHAPLDDREFQQIHALAQQSKFISQDFHYESASNLYPLDAFAAYAITRAIQRYGQNERSLFTFLNLKGANSIAEFKAQDRLTYNLSDVYDYVTNSFHSYLTDANSDSMGWSSIRLSIERVEGNDWAEPQMMLDAIKLVKAIGLINLFGNGGFTMRQTSLAEYASMAMGIEMPHRIIAELERLKIIRFAEYKKRLVLFEGTDVNIEEEITNAGLIIPRPVNFTDDLRRYFNNRVSPVKAYYYHRGTPRYFDYQLLPEPQDIIPTGDVDGYVELVFSSSKKSYKDLVAFSQACEHAIIFAYFNNTDEIVEHLWNIQKYQYILEKVLIDKSDRVALKEVMSLKDYETTLLNKSINESLFSYTQDVTWLYKGKECKVDSQRDFNKLLSVVCDDVYYKTPIINNELFNKHKLSGNISGAKAKYLQALLDDGDKPDLGFEADKFPPEKTIYYALLKNTGLHVNGEFMEAPSNKDIQTLWEACEDFMRSTMERPRKVGELIKLLSAQPYKIKEGCLDFWIPTYLFIKRQDYALYGENGQYIPNFNIELFDLMKKHSGSFKVKAYAVDGVKLQLFNQYRQFLNLDGSKAIKSKDFIDTIKPFLFFYNKQLNDYAKYTLKIDHQETLRFRDVLSRAKDPEKAFLEDLPEALGYDEEKLANEEQVQNYCYLIQRAVRELRGCYNSLIDRIEQHLVEGIGLSTYEYPDYVLELQDRLSKIKQHLLTPRQKEFYQHAMAKFDKRQEWYQSVCYAILDGPLDRMRDDQEEKLLDDLVFLFRECEKASVLSEGLNYRIDETEEERSNELEARIIEILTGDDNLDVYTIMRILQKKMKK